MRVSGSAAPLAAVLLALRAFACCVPLALARLIGANRYFNRLDSPPAHYPAPMRIDSVDAS